MPRGKRKNIVQEEKLEPLTEIKVFGKTEILKEAKRLGVFKFNKYLGRYEIIIEKDEYDKL